MSEDRYFLLNADGNVISSWEHKEDAEDAKRSPTDYHSEADSVLPIKVYTRQGLARKGIKV